MAAAQGTSGGAGLALMTQKRAAGLEAHAGREAKRGQSPPVAASRARGLFHAVQRARWRSWRGGDGAELARRPQAGRATDAGRGHRGQYQEVQAMRKRTSSSGPQGPHSGRGRSEAPGSGGGRAGAGEA